MPWSFVCTASRTARQMLGTRAVYHDEKDGLRACLQNSKDSRAPRYNVARGFPRRRNGIRRAEGTVKRVV